MKRLCFSFFIFLSVSVSHAQEITQTLRGRVADLESKSSLPGASVAVYKDSALVTGASSDGEGFYRIEKLPLGRYTVKITFLGYRPVVLSNIILTSAKEVILNVEMEESSIAMKEIEIAAMRKDQTVNEMATVSARTFSVEETNRYAGSRGDPARMASNFAGVQGADDSRNDIVIRGNSPLGVLWRLEGVDIPNPNHFAIAGTTGGPVGILNNKVLETSDFMTGAFPAEYGNSMAGVFDLRMRNGNNEQLEFTGQFGFLGTEFSAEGPISKKDKSSYLITYRYSTLQLFDALNIRIGTSAIPQYQDFAFKFNLPSSDGSNLSVFGIGGKSKIDIKVSDFTEPQEEIYGEGNRDQYFGSSMGVTGISYSKSINPSTYIKFVIAGSANESHSHHDLVYRDTTFKIDSIIPQMGYSYIEQRITGTLFLNKKFGASHTIKLGVHTDRYTFNFTDSNYFHSVYRFINRHDYTGVDYLFQPYLQWKLRAGANIVINAGVHAQYFTLNDNSFSLEPRAGIRWLFAEKQSLAFGTGFHSQMQPAYTYFYHLPSSYKPHNINIGFTNSSHYVATYDNLLGNNLRLKVESYLQLLSDVPVEKKKSSFSLLNQGTGFSRFFPDTLVNEGTGKNYGIEFTLEKFFSNHYFFMMTASIFDSKFRGSDGIDRNTDFNGNFALNLLGTGEIKIKEKNTISIGTKVTFAGGRRYSPVDVVASAIEGDEIVVDSLRNSLQFNNYFRADLKINYRINRKKVTHEIGLDLVNILNTKNILSLTYAPNPTKPSSNPVVETYQLGFLPLFYYKLDF